MLGVSLSYLTNPVSDNFGPYSKKSSLYHHKHLSFALLPVSINLRLWHVWIFLVYLELAKHSIFLSKLVRKALFEIPVILGVPLKDRACTCLYHCL